MRLTGTVEGEDVVLVAGLDRPDDKVLPLLFAAATARDLGATSVGLVAPYLPYLRQDRRFQAGEGISARYFARLLSQAVDWLVTVDPHLHRIGIVGRDSSAFPRRPCTPRRCWRGGSGGTSSGRSCSGRTRKAASGPRPSRTAGRSACRLRQAAAGDRRVEMPLPDLAAYAGRRPVLVDDIVSTGRTMAAAVRALRSAGLAGAGLSRGARASSPAAPTTRCATPAPPVIVTCNTIAHPTNGIDVQGLLADAAARRLRAGHAPAAMA